MDINNMDFVQLLPAFMREDRADIGLSKAVDTVTEQIAKKAVTGSTWDQLDNMCEAEIDLLADELNITWYDRTASLSVKRQIIKDSDLIHSKMGTTWAAERVVETYFETGNIIDWYDYDGEPYHFKIQTKNRNVLNTKQTVFLDILDTVKRKSTVLDNIEVQVEDESYFKIGIADRKMVENTSEVDARKRRFSLYFGIGHRTLRVMEGSLDLSEYDVRRRNVELYIGIEHRVLKLMEGGVDLNEVYING